MLIPPDSRGGGGSPTVQNVTLPRRKRIQPMHGRVTAECLSGPRHSRLCSAHTGYVGSSLTLFSVAETELRNGFGPGSDPQSRVGS